MSCSVDVLSRKVLKGIGLWWLHSQPDGLLLLRNLDAIHNLESSHYRVFLFAFGVLLLFGSTGSLLQLTGFLVVVHGV